MAPKFLYDVASVDLEHIEHSIEEIREINPHRHEFEQLSAILLFRPEEKIIVGLREIRADEFWVRGHIPGHPVFPGVLMLEAAAQGLGIAIMHDDHMRRAADDRLTDLFGIDVESPYSYWFVCKPAALEERPVRMFHDWLIKAGL